MKYLILILIAAASIAAVNDLKLKIYYVITYRSNERVIEKVYLKKENAQKYCDMYKDSHNYSVEERELTE